MKRQKFVTFAFAALLASVSFPASANCINGITPQTYSGDQNEKTLVQKAVEAFGAGPTLSSVGKPIAELIGGVTNIKRIRNDTPCLLRIRKVDKKFAQADTQTVDVAPNSTWEGDFWIPWASSQAEFNDHHMTLAVDGRIFAWLFQQEGVRFKAEEGYAPNQPTVPGEAKAGGDRSLTVGMMGASPTFVLGRL
ncbi:MAG TPA: hypothetical protein VF782_02385 [Allosphingosinicella sp.]|jgi:hypothetical protein